MQLLEDALGQAIAEDDAVLMAVSTAIVRDADLLTIALHLLWVQGLHVHALLAALPCTLLLVVGASPQ